MLGSRVVLGWIMIVGVVVGLPVAIASPPPATIAPSTFGLLLLGGSCYVIGLQLTYAALRIGKVLIVAPIVSTEGAVAAVISIALGDPIGVVAGLMLIAIAVGVVLSSLKRDRGAVPAGDFGVTADALEDPAADPLASAPAHLETRRAAILSIIGAVVFGVGLVAAGRAAVLVLVAWVALAARLVGMVGVVLPLLLQRRLRLTRAALPLVVIAGSPRSSDRCRRPGVRVRASRSRPSWGASSPRWRRSRRSSSSRSDSAGSRSLASC